MELHTFFNKLKAIERVAKSRVKHGECFAFVGHSGDEIAVAVVGADFYGNLPKGIDPWTKTVYFRGKTSEAEKLLEQAMTAAGSIPDADGRAVEFMLKSLHALVEAIPATSDDPGIQAAWDSYREALLAQSKKLANNILPKTLHEAKP